MPLDDEPTIVNMDLKLADTPALELQQILDGLQAISQQHPDALTGMAVTTEHMMQFDGYDAEGFAAGVCYMKDLISTVFRQANFTLEVNPQDLISNVGNAVGWAATVALAKYDTDQMLAEAGEEE